MVFGIQWPMDLSEYRTGSLPQKFPDARFQTSACVDFQRPRGEWRDWHEKARSCISDNPLMEPERPYHVFHLHLLISDIG